MVVILACDSSSNNFISPYRPVRGETMRFQHQLARGLVACLHVGLFCHSDICSMFSQHCEVLDSSSARVWVCGGNWMHQMAERKIHNRYELQKFATFYFTTKD
jgi:hypothetical protein